MSGWMYKNISFSKGKQGRRNWVFNGWMKKELIFNLQWENQFPLCKWKTSVKNRIYYKHPILNQIKFLFICLILVMDQNFIILDTVQTWDPVIKMPVHCLSTFEFLQLFLLVKWNSSSNSRKSDGKKAKPDINIVGPWCYMQFTMLSLGATFSETEKQMAQINCLLQRRYNTCALHKQLPNCLR